MIVFYTTIGVNCVGNKKLDSEFHPLKMEGYYIETYKYGFDSAASNYGYWYYDRKFISKEYNLPLAGDISNFSSIFNCEEFKKAADYVKNKKETYGKSVFKDEDGCYFRDETGAYLYYIVFAKGEFIQLRSPLCKKDKNAFNQKKDKAPCKFAPKLIRSYPFLIPSNYDTTDTVSLKTAELIMQSKGLEKVKKEALRFFVCI